MILTNKNHLPEILVRAIKNDSYDRGNSDFTITELLGPPRQRALQKKFRDEISEDASDRLYSLYGQIGHGIIERAGEKSELTEQRYYAQYGDHIVSGQIDSLTLLSGRLCDWKFTTSYKFIAGKPKPWEYIFQLNMQADILRRNGIAVKTLEICGLLRDWQKAKAKYDKLYPQTPICLMPIDLLSPLEIDKFVKGRITLFLEAERKLPECSKEETWSGRRCESYCNVASQCERERK